MTKSEIKNNYNIDKIVAAKELASLSKTYHDNLDTIILMMKKKEKNTQPPVWFKEFVDKAETFMTEQKLFNKNIVKNIAKIVDLNNLKTE